MTKAELINFLKPFANDIQILVNVPKEGFNISKVSYLQVGPVLNNDNKIFYIKNISQKFRRCHYHFKILK
jgi:hypothetical protein